MGTVAVGGAAETLALRVLVGAPGEHAAGVTLAVDVAGPFLLALLLE